MANPQKENGFTSISNELFEVILSSDFTLREMKIIFAVIRFTYGFGRTEAFLSLRFLSNATKIYYRHTQTTLNKLISKNVLLIQSEATGIKPRRIKLNKDYESWINRVDQKSITIDNLGLTDSVKSSDTFSVNTTIDQKSIKERKKKTIKKERNSFSIENIPLDQNGILFYKNSFFYITQDFKDELIRNISGLTEERLLTEFYKMQIWLEKNKKKKDYQQFIVNWLSKNEYPQGSTTQNDFSFNPVKIYEQT